MNHYVIEDKTEKSLRMPRTKRNIRMLIARATTCQDGADIEVDVLGLWVVV